MSSAKIQHCACGFRVAHDHPVGRWQLQLQGLEAASPKSAENRLNIRLQFWKLKHFQAWKGGWRLAAMHYPSLRSGAAAAAWQGVAAEVDLAEVAE